MLVAGAVVLAGFVAAPAVKANLVLGSSGCTYFAGTTSPSASQLASVCGVDSSHVGSLLCQYGNGGQGNGQLQNSYSCSSGLNKINYCGGTYASATCFIVKCGTGCYVWNACNWNGTDEVDCTLNCGQTECDVYGNCKQPPTPPGSVPEPTTVIAGALLLLPFGVSTFRILRRNKNAAAGE